MQTARIAAFFAGILPLLPIACEPATPAAQEEVHPAPVKAVAARSLSLGEWIEIYGSTVPLPNHSARVSAAVEGRVSAIASLSKNRPVTEGDEVKAGDPIIKLDDHIIRANIARTRATLLDLAEQKHQAEIAVEVAQLNERSKAELRQKKPEPLTSQLELDMARLALQDAQSKQKGVEAKQTATQEDLKVLEEQLRLFTLQAPIAGRLGLLQVVPGQVLSVGAAVADIVDLQEIDVLSFVPPHVAARLAIGQPARLSGGDLTESVEPTGKVVFIAVQAQADTGNFPIKVRFPNPDLKLRSNTVVRVEVQITPEKERLTIPEAALMEDQDPPGVIVFVNMETKKNDQGKEEKVGKAKRLKARIGIRDRRWKVVEILGLEAGEKKETFPLEDALFISEGGQGLQDDDVVKLDEEEEEEK
jgi:membrane fusion protein, multidrug efflux system